MGTQKHSHCRECGYAISREGAGQPWVDANGSAACHVSWSAEKSEHTPQPQKDFCSVANDGCLNPPGHRSGRGYFVCEDPRTSTRCSYCGDAVCANCRIGKRGAWYCKTHSRQELEWTGADLPPRVKYAVTFGLKYNDPRVAHPTDKRITGQHYVVFEADDYEDFRAQVAETLGDAWAWDYAWDDFQEQIEKYGYLEFKLGEPLP